MISYESILTSVSLGLLATTSPCVLPLYPELSGLSEWKPARVVGIFTFSLTAGEAIDRLSVFLWFGLGFGLPLLAYSFLSGASQRWITRQFARHSRLINAIGGILLIGVAIYDLATNWAFLV
jgi:cytochrome c biogenesis protein CcdA